MDDRKRIVIVSVVLAIIILAGICLWVGGPALMNGLIAMHRPR